MKKKSLIKTENEMIVDESFQKSSLNKLSLMMAFICGLLGFLLYVNTIGHDYTIDDDTVIQKNKIVVQGVKAIPEIFTTPYRKGFWDREEGMYRPLSLVMFAAEWQCAPGNPMPGHLMNILIYALTGFVLFITLKRMLSRYNLFVPFITTLLFIAHPIHTEVVANIKSRDELLCFLFFILTLNSLFLHIQNKNKLLPGFSLIFFFLALLSKESAVTFLAVFPLALFFFTDLNRSKIIQYSVLFFIPLALYFGLRYSALHEFSSHVEILTINNSLANASGEISRLATAIKILGKYLALLILPHPLSFDYSYNQIPNISFGDIFALISLIIYTLIFAYSIYSFRKKNIFSFCILYFLITISLVSNIFFMIECTMAERFLYSSSLAFCLAIAFLIIRLFRVDPLKINFYNWKTFFSTGKSIPLMVFILLILYSFKTINRNEDWKNNIVLLKKDMKTSPNSCRIHYSYGSTILFKYAMKEKDEQKKSIYLDEAISNLEKGVEILPTYAEAFYHLGLAYTEKKDPVNAVRCFDSAKQSKEWNDAEFYVSSGLANHLAKQNDKSYADFQRAIQINPLQKEAYNNWGLSLTEAGKPAEAIEKLNKATEIDSGFISAWYNKGNAYAQSSDYIQAITCYEKAISINPSYTDAMVNIGNCYAAMKDIQKSIGAYEKVLAIDPSNFNAISNLAISYKILGNEKKSMEYSAMISTKK